MYLLASNALLDMAAFALMWIRDAMSGACELLEFDNLLVLGIIFLAIFGIALLGQWIDPWFRRAFDAPLVKERTQLEACREQITLQEHMIEILVSVHHQHRQEILSAVDTIRLCRAQWAASSGDGDTARVKKSVVLMNNLGEMVERICVKYAFGDHPLTRELNRNAADRQEGIDSA